jgi:hypothetical protein
MRWITWRTMRCMNMAGDVCQALISGPTSARRGPRRTVALGWAWHIIGCRLPHEARVKHAWSGVDDVAGACNVCAGAWQILLATS